MSTTMSELPEALQRRVWTLVPPSVVDTIAAVIRDWDWSDYGLDEVESADPEYATFLARDIAAALLPPSSGYTT